MAFGIKKSLQLIGPPHQQAGGVWVVDSEYEIDRLYERLMTPNEVFSVDTETRDINPKEESPAKGNGRIVVWSAAYFDEKLGTHPTTGYPLAQRIFVKNWGEAEEKRWLYKFQEWFEGPQYKKVGANFFGFDRHVFGNYGINVQGVYFDNVRASRLNDASAMEHGLKFQAIEYLGYVMRDYNELFKRAKLKKDGKPGKQMVLVPLLTVVQDPDWLNILIDYASLDAKISLELWPVMRDKLAKKEWRRDGTTMADYYDKLQTPYYYVLNGAEREGWDLDEQWCSEQAEIATRDMDRLERELVEWSGVVMNFGSPKQLGHLLYATVPDTVVKANRNLIPGFGFSVPPVSKNKNRPKPWEEEDEENPFRPTDATALLYLADNVRAKKDKKGLRTLLEWRKIKDIKKYLIGLPTFQDINGRVHCNTAPDTECMPAGQLVLTNRGYQPVEKVIIGDSVVTHAARTRQVIGKVENSIQVIYTVKLDNGLSLRTTGNHAYHANNSWIRADMLRPGDVVTTHVSGPECWKQIDGWPQFEVSNWGRVRNWQTKHLMKQINNDKWGHLTVQLYRNGAQTRKHGDRKDFRVHRLVAQAFVLGESSVNKEVRHLDGVSWNNCSGNLKWGTTKENRQDAIDHGTMSHRGYNNRQVKLTLSDVEFIRSGHGLSNGAVARSLGVSVTIVRLVKERLRWMAPSVSCKPHRMFSDAEVVSVSITEAAKTYGLTVDEDHSHVTGGIVTHNTARLSARKPALQQIPTPGKDPVADRYMIREAFTCPPGFMLIGADFSQLEMRILAHYLIVLFQDYKLAEDLKASDLHSATALRVFGKKDIQLSEKLSRQFDGIKVVESWEQVARYIDDPEKCKFLNELPFVPHDTPVKLIKKFLFSFRNKGKIVNFSVNYKKTAWGLGFDLRDENGDPIGEEAAQVILDAYFEAYPAVLRFGKWAIGYATKRGFARSLLGRYRPLPLIWDQNRGIRGHEERKAVNTPIQMSAAEIAMMAQLKTNTVDLPELRDAGFYDDELARMGVVHLMQIHDELIFKVPRAHAVEACARVKMLMENPLDTPLTVPLPVEAKVAMNWASVK